MGEQDKPKYFVRVYSKEKALKVKKDVIESLKGAFRGKLLSRMKKEAIDCPVFLQELAFLECFTCSNFIRRIKGEVHCKGLPLSKDDLYKSL